MIKKKKRIMMMVYKIIMIGESIESFGDDDEIDDGC